MIESINKKMLSKKVAISGAVVSLALLSGCALPTSQPVSGTGGDAGQDLNTADAVAILSGSTLLTQTPQNNADGVGDTFVQELAATKDNPSDPALDVGFVGAQLVDYQVSPEGLSAPVCFITAAPANAEPAATQGNWVTYYDPGVGEELVPAVLVEPGIQTCDEARVRMDEITAAGEREQVDAISGNTIRQAYNAVPFSQLTPVALEVFDALRTAG